MDNAGHAARIAKIRQQHQWESPHIKERQTWKNMDYLLNRVDELERCLALLEQLPAGSELHKCNDGWRVWKQTANGRHAKVGDTLLAALEAAQQETTDAQ